MLTIARMKSIITPAFPFFPHFNKIVPFPLVSLASNSKFSTSTTLSNSKFIDFKATMNPPRSSIFALRNRHLQTESFPCSSSGEIHVIVGPMFAGKTTTLLRRIQAETENGSFQVELRKNQFQLDKTLKGLCFSGMLSEAVGLLCRTGLKLDAGTYSLLLQECIFRKEYRKGRRIHAQMVMVGYASNEYLTTKLLILYAKSRDLITAHILFDKLQEKGLISWNAMISGYVQKGNEEVGLSFYYEMRENGLMPDQYTFASVFRACASLATLEHGKRAHGVMIKCNVKGNVVVNSALIDMYFKCSSISAGQKVFDVSLERNVVTWTALISGYGQHGRVKEVLESFNKMRNEGFRPNYVTFLAVLSACSHGGLVDKGWAYFSSMVKDYGIKPRGQHYAAMVDLLGRAGKLKEAYEFVLSSPCDEHSVIWGVLLGACRIHGDIDLLKLAARRYFELDSGNSGKYVVLANAYAAFGSWSSVAEVRGTMRDLGVMKEPGYSWIEVQGKVHFFLMGDKSQEYEEICEMIKEMSCVLKDAGHIPVVRADSSSH